jgi:hypothetical protein
MIPSPPSPPHPETSVPNLRPEVPKLRFKSMIPLEGRPNRDDQCATPPLAAMFVRWRRRGCERGTSEQGVEVSSKSPELQTPNSKLRLCDLCSPFATFARNPLPKPQSHRPSPPNAPQKRNLPYNRLVLPRIGGNKEANSG